jgi:hypothetical protein
MEAAERAQKVYELKLRGHSFPDIARQLNISHKSALRCFERVFRKIPAAEGHRYRKLQLEEYERIRSLLWTASAQDPIGAAMGLIRLADREAKLLGLDSPTKLDVENPNKAKLSLPIIRALLERFDKIKQDERSAVPALVATTTPAMQVEDDEIDTEKESASNSSIELTPLERFRRTGGS